MQEELMSIGIMIFKQLSDRLMPRARRYVVVCVYMYPLRGEPERARHSQFNGDCVCLSVIVHHSVHVFTQMF